MGLSYGFIEPLESTGLSFITEGISRLVTILLTRDRHITQFDRECFTREMQSQLDIAKYFVGFHFFGSVRDDTEYWRWYTQELEMESDWNNYSSGVHLRFSKDETMDLSRNRLHYTFCTINLLSAGMQCITVGHHINLYSDFTRKRIQYQFPETDREFWKEKIKEALNYWKDRNKKINLLADKSPTHYEYLKEKIYNQR